MGLRNIYKTNGYVKNTKQFPTIESGTISKCSSQTWAIKESYLASVELSN